MGIRPKLVAASLLLLWSCAPPPQKNGIPATAPPPPGPPPAAQAPKSRDGYRLAPSQLAKSAFANDEQLEGATLLGGKRIASELGGLTLAASVTDPPLRGGQRIPDFQGGGFLFWNQNALYRSDAFLGTLKPIATLAFSPERVSFGPGFALILGSSRERVALDLRAKKRVRPTPPLLVDVAANGHRVLALLENGAVACSSDAGATFTPVVLPPSEVATGVLLENDNFFVALESGSRLRVSGAGAGVLEPAPPHKKSLDPAWPFSESPLERALGYGVPLEPGFAAVAVHGSVALVDLASGAVVRATRSLAPSGLECRLLELTGPGAPLLACSNTSVGTVVFADTLSERPRQVLRAPAEAELEVTGGVLVMSGPCDGTASSSSVCIRGADGGFTTYDVADRLAKLGPDQPQVARWIAKQDGGAVGLIVAPPGLLDAKSHEFSPFQPELADAALAALGAQPVGLGSIGTLGTPATKPQKKKGHRASTGSGWFVTLEGDLRGWQDDGALAITREGRVLPPVLTFHQLVTAGTRASAVDGSAHVFQTLDLGRTWSETLAPPGYDGHYPLSGHCSLAGCQLGPWLREGWNATAPVPASRPSLSDSAANLIEVPAPELSCTELAPPVSSTQHVGDEQNGAGFGATQVPLARGAKHYFRSYLNWAITLPEPGSAQGQGLRGLLYGEAVDVGGVPEGAPLPENLGLSRPRTLSYIAPFDPRAKVLHASTDLRTLLRAQLSQGESTTLPEDDEGELFTVPVLARGPAQTDGFLALEDGPLLWLREPAAVDVFALTGELEQATVLSALALDAHTLVLLVLSSESTTSVVEVKNGQARRLFALAHGPAPANPDALALGPNGKLAILRTRSGDDPASDADPAILLADGAAPVPLAPWSSVELADAPACAEAPDDYRVLLQTTGSWLKLVDSGVASGAEAGASAIVRVNAQRWCLEALETPHDEIRNAEGGVPSRLVARFAGKSKGAARVAIAPGLELRQPLACSIKH